MKRFAEWSLFSLFPRHCPYCDVRIPGSRMLCEECENNLPRIAGEICSACGREKSEKYLTIAERTNIIRTVPN